MEPLTRRSFLLALLASGVVAACGDDGGGTSASPTDPDPGATTAPDQSTSTPSPATGELTPVAHGYQRTEPAADAPVAQVVAADRALAAELYAAIAEVEPGNLIFSPYSIAVALSMTGAGAAGDTAEQMRQALNIDIDDSEWHAGRNALDVAITTAGQVPPGMTPLELRIANTPFGQAGYQFVDGFIRVLAEQYGADLVTVDFISDPEAARGLINGWIADQTDDRITDLLPTGSIDDLVRLVLVNTVFFKGQWVTEFDPAQTAPGPFTLLDGSTVDTPLMNGSVRTTYGTGDGWQMVRLPYWGGYSMIVVVPDEGRFDEVSDRLVTGLVAEVSTLRNDHLVALTMPKFDFATPTDLVPVLKTLGVVDAFDPAIADFSALTPAPDFYISGAYHQATIEVDEFGTTATAATGVVGSATSAPTPAELRIDRPFLFTIEHDDSGEPLFYGRVVDPTA